MASNTKRAALAYAELGYAVFPLHGIENGQCTCGKPTCKRAGKHPRHDKDDLPNGCLNATTNEAQIETWWQRWSNSNVAIATGAASGVIVLDIDKNKEGYENLEKVTREKGALPDTPTQESGNGGRHYLFRRPATLRGKEQRCPNLTGRVAVRKGVEIKGDEGFIVAAPSELPSGGYYRWLIQPSELIAEPPAWIIGGIEDYLAQKEREEKREASEAAGRVVRQQAVSERDEKELARTRTELAVMGPDSGRHERLFRAAYALGGLVAADRIDEFKVETELESAAAQCGLTHDDGIREVRRTIRDGLKSGKNSPRLDDTPPAVTTLPPPRHADEQPPDLAEAFGESDEGLPDAEDPLPAPSDDLTLKTLNTEHAEQKAHDVNLYRSGNKPTKIELARSWAMLRARGVYQPFEGNRWFQYHGGFWTRIDQDHPRNCAHQYLTSLESGGEQITVSADLVAEILKLGRDELGIQTDKVFNVNANWLPLRNGIYDIDKGHLIPHHPDNWVTYQLPFAYDPTADCPRWKAFLNEALIYTDGRPCQEWIDQVQEWYGYLLIPHTGAQQSMFWVGGGANGKGVAQGVIQAMLPDLWITVPVEQLDREYTMITLQNKLVGFIPEIHPRAMQKNNSYFKQISGGDPVSGRQPTERVITFKPKVRLIVTCNDLPKSGDPSYAYFRRICVIEWRYEVPREKRDTELGTKLAAELPGIFNWALEGLMRLRDRGYRFLEPEESQRLLEDYRNRQDQVRQYIDERCETDCEYRVFFKSLYADYVAWCEEAGERSVSRIEFGRRLTNLHYEEKNTEYSEGKGRYRFGLRLRRDGSDTNSSETSGFADPFTTPTDYPTDSRQIN